MKKIIFSFVILINCILSAQTDFIIKQITNYDYDSRNPYIVNRPVYLPDPGEFVFEIRKVNETNIGLIKYIIESDSFSSPLTITDDTSNNINPSITEEFIDNPVILFQTDINGNWDLAISVENDGIWSNPEFITNSGEDETNPIFLSAYSFNYEPFDTLWILYEKNQSIHLLSYKQGVTADRIIFEAHDSISYSSPTGFFDSPMQIAAVENSPTQKRLVYRKFDNIEGTLFPIHLISGDGSPDNPRFFNSLGFEFLSYTAEQTNGLRNIYYTYDWEDNNPEPWVDDPSGDLSSLAVTTVSIITESRWGTGDANTYFVARNDSNFIRLNLQDSNPFFLQLDTLLYIKVDNPNSDIGNIGTILSDAICYTVFEDSSNGHINLFARKDLVSLDKVTAVNQSDLHFYLSQNYPNPFNPSTRISFIVNKSSLVSLKVYDVLGNEVETLVNEEKSPGTYNINFNASGLSSGVYFYRLKSGTFSETKKMIFLK